MAWSLVQQAQDGVDTGTPSSLTVTFGSTPAPGNIILISASETSSLNALIQSAADGNGNDATDINSRPDYDNALRLTQFVLQVPAPASDTIVITTADPDCLSIYCCISEWSGGSVSTDGTAQAGYIQPGTIGAGDVVTSFANDIIWTSVAAAFIAGFSLVSGASLLGQIPGSDATCWLSDAYQVETSAGTYDPQWNCPQNTGYVLLNTALQVAAPGSGFFPFFGA
jgi:hypothetical protein